MVDLTSLKVGYTVSIVDDDSGPLKISLPEGLVVQSYLNTRRRPEPLDLFILLRTRTVLAAMQLRLRPCKVVDADDHLILRQPFADKL